MFDKNKNYWLWIAPHVYCRIESTKAILYNTQNGLVLKTDSAEAVELLTNLYDKTNLGAIYFEGIMLADYAINEFLITFCEKNMGGLVDIDEEKSKPIQMMPVLNLQQDIDRKQQHDSLIFAKHTLHYLLELNIYINGKCKEDCALCYTNYQQCLCCTKSLENDHMQLDIDALQKILHQIKYSSVGKINIMGGDVSMYSHINMLLESLSTFEDRVHIWSHYANFDKQDVMPVYNYDIIVTFPYNNGLFRLCNNAHPSGKYHFYVTSTDEYEIVESIISEYDIDNYNIYPIYTGDNLDFFQQNIYSSEEDILESTIPFHRIFANQKLNSNYFGILTILPTGDVYANINYAPIGNIKYNTIHEIIRKELQIDTAWRNTRQSPPCSDCLYQYLCPSPSNYEIVIGKQNLCYIK